MKLIKKLTLVEILEVLEQYDICSLHQDVMGKDEGVCDFKNETIYINQDQTPQAYMKTLIHEMSHAYHEMHGLKDSEKNTMRIQRATWKDYQKLKRLER